MSYYCTIKKYVSNSIPRRFFVSPDLMEVARQALSKKDVDDFFATHRLTLVPSDAADVLLSMVAEVAGGRPVRNRRPSQTANWPLQVLVYPADRERYDYCDVSGPMCAEPEVIQLERGFEVKQVAHDGATVVQVCSETRLLQLSWDTSRKQWTFRPSSLRVLGTPSARRAGARRMGYGPDRSISR